MVCPEMARFQINIKHTASRCTAVEDDISILMSWLMQTTYRYYYYVILF
jgi:hypothetical protein